MITIEEAKKILADDTMSDQEVEAALNGLQLLVEIVFDHWSEERNISKVLSTVENNYHENKEE